MLSNHYIAAVLLNSFLRMLLHVFTSCTVLIRLAMYGFVRSQNEC